MDPRYTWDLTEFYSSKAAWETELERLRSEVDFLAPYAGKLGDDEATLLAALESELPTAESSRGYGPAHQSAQYQSRRA